ncbi:O-methyltransferase family protein [Thermotomaculum hydrothermale]|uniref:O-methyltransferase family protein n=1 Tax=Thermotomaculum hydrothermale TaxID=981385 RepID=A0A7R6PS67_9BACT|nr:methyltransferase [Thermotomaculum hydrothermale]BBB33371.1 O-methyltransferase family protein [Thermotomaculum hydrothermale]
MHKPITKDDLMNLARKWQESRVFLAACELDIFSHLSEFKSSGELAEELKVKERYLDRLLNTLVVLGLLEKRDGRFKNTDAANTYLDKKSRDYLLGLTHQCHVFYGWSLLTDVVKNGIPSRELGFGKPIENWLEPFITAMQQYASERAPKLIDLIDFSNCKKFLDLGGGSGANSVEVARRYPDIDVFIFDLTDVIPITKKFVSKAGDFKNIHYIEGDYLKDSIGEGYDVILLSNIIHAHGKDEVIKIFKRCNNALKDKGRIIIHDFLVNEDRVSPPWSVFFAINMLVHTKNGDTYTEREIREFFKEANFSFVSNTPTGFNSDVIVGVKN